MTTISTADVAPSNYELWRDAWGLAVVNTPQAAGPGELRDNAEWFLGRLKAGPPLPPEPDCSHCGADSSMDHDEECPSVLPAPTADATGLDLDNRAVAARSAAILLETTDHLDPSFPVTLGIDSYHGATDIHLHRCTFQDASALADRLGLTEHTSSPSDQNIHHHWSGVRGGVALRVVWLDPKAKGEEGK